MQATLLITHFGTPLLLLGTHLQPAAARQLAPCPSASIDFTADGLHLSLPPGLFPVPDAEVPGFAPEILNHLRQLPGLWCVAVDITGTPVAEWAAVRDSSSVSDVEALLPNQLAGSLRYLDAVQDGVFAVAQSHSWPPGRTLDGAIPNVPAAVNAVFRSLQNHPVEIVPPAGGFFGAVGHTTAADQDDDAALRGRLGRAVAALAAITVNGQKIGENLLAVQRRANIEIAWSTSPLPQTTATWSAPRCGWDSVTKTIYLPAVLDPLLDSAYLGAALYAANASLSGQSAITKFAANVLRTGDTTTFGPNEFIASATNEAARAWLLLAELCRGARTADGLGLATAESALSSLPWGQVLSLLPASTCAGQDYTVALMNALAEAAKILSPHLTAGLLSLWNSGMSIGDAWFNPRNRALLPVPRPAAATPVRSPSRPPAPMHVCSETTVSFPPGGAPEILYTAPTYADLKGEALVNLPAGGTHGTVLLERTDGVKVYLTEIPPKLLQNLVAAQTAAIFWADGRDGLSQPQSVAVRKMA